MTGPRFRLRPGPGLGPGLGLGLVLVLGVGVLVPSVATAAPPVVEHREVHQGVDRPIHDLAGAGDSSSLELNPALLNSVPGLDITALGYQAVYEYARGAGFGAFASVNIGWGFALGFGVQALDPRFGDDTLDVDAAHNRPSTKLSFGLAAGDGEWGSFGVGVHGLRVQGQRIRSPQLDLGAVVRMTNFASFGAVARLAPANLEGAGYRPILDLGGELAVRPFGNRWLEFAGGVTARVDQSQGAGFSNFELGHDLLAHGRAIVRYQGLEIAGEVQQIQVDELDEDTFAITDQRTALRGGVSVGFAWDYVSVGIGAHAGLGGGLDGMAYKARFSTARQGRAIWRRPLAIDKISLGKVGNQRSMIATLRKLERAEAAGDRAVVLIEVDGFGLGWGAGQELREAIRRVRDAGGHVYAWAEAPGLREYWLASVAERVYTHPAGQFDTVGLGTRRLYFRDALAKLGVKVQSVHVDEYKSAHENFTRADRSDYDTEQRSALLDDTWETVVHDIAQARGLSKSRVRELVVESPLGPEQAVEVGFADAVRHRDEIAEAIGADLEADVSFQAFAPISPEPQTWGPEPYYAVVLIEGTIIDGKSRYIPLLDITMTGGDTIAETLRQLRADSACKGIVLRVDSGGGSAFASEVMWREVQRTREAWEKQPRSSPAIVVSMSDIAASGGYYVPVGADHIVAEPLTVTGSIGVVYMHFDVSGLLDMLGVGLDRIDRGGAGIDMNAIWQPWSPEQLEKVNAGIQRTYDLFLQRVADGRGMKKEAVDAVGRGHIWSGKRAKDIGLVDAHGGLREALDELGDRSGQPAYRQLPLRVLPIKPTLVQLLLRGAGSLVTERVDAVVDTRKSEARAKLPLAVDQALAKLPLSILFLPQDQANVIVPGEISVE